LGSGAAPEASGRTECPITIVPYGAKILGKPAGEPAEFNGWGFVVSQVSESRPAGAPRFWLVRCGTTPTPFMGECGSL
jgi:hypothetical protein